MKEKTPEQTLTQFCYEQLQEEIINGELKPGEKLKILQLKQKLGVGHTPIREALSRLASSGLVDIIENKGFRVATINEEDIMDIHRTFAQIEILALKQAMELGDEAWEAQIVSTLHSLTTIETREGTVDYQTWSERNNAFHEALIAGCHSPCLIKIRNDLQLRFDRYCRFRFYASHAPLAVNNKEHQRLAQAVLKREVGQASEIMQKHICGLLEETTKLLKEKKLL